MFEYLRTAAQRGEQKHFGCHAESKCVIFSYCNSRNVLNFSWFPFFFGRFEIAPQSRRAESVFQHVLKTTQNRKRKTEVAFSAGVPRCPSRRDRRLEAGVDRAPAGAFVGPLGADAGARHAGSLWPTRYGGHVCSPQERHRIQQYTV